MKLRVIVYTTVEILDCAGTVLVVDDDPTVVKLVRLSLEGVGFRVYGALDAATALGLLSNAALEIAVAVIDYELPGSRLDELLQEVRSQPRFIRSIVTSGYPLDMMEEIGGALPPGVEFLKKPFLPRHLVAAVRRAFVRSASTAS